MAITIHRTPWIDDDGSGTSGTVLNNAMKTGLYDEIDGALGQGPSLSAPNTFTGNPQTLQAATPQLVLIDTSRPADSKVFRVLNGNGQFVVDVLNDAQSVQQAVLMVLDRTGNATFGGQITMTGRILEVAAASPLVDLFDTSQPVDSRTFIMMNANQTLTVQAFNDALSVAGGPPALTLTRPGDTKIGRDVYEKGRTTPMGHWIAVPYSAANFTGGSGMTWTVAAGDQQLYRYTLIGKTMTVAFSIGGVIGGTPAGDLHIVLPAGLASANSATVNPFWFYNGAFGVGYAQVNGPSIQLNKPTQAAWAAGSGNVFAGQITFELT
jgi:hypothetical protein